MDGMTMPMGTESTMTSAASSTMSAMSTSAAAASSDMDVGGSVMSMGDGCEISMLWNWYTIDACFLTSSWRIRSQAMFAGSCIGVVLLLIVLEGLRRAAREYDAFIIRRHYASASSVARPVTPSSSNSGSDNKNVVASTRDCASGATIAPMMPSFVQQLVRATLSMLQLVVAFIAMLLAMYFNGYIIISIFVGGWIGSFIFGWHRLAAPGQQREQSFCCG